VHEYHECWGGKRRHSKGQGNREASSHKPEGARVRRAVGTKARGERAAKHGLSHSARCSRRQRRSGGRAADEGRRDGRRQ